MPEPSWILSHRMCWSRNFGYHTLLPHTSAQQDCSHRCWCFSAVEFAAILVISTPTFPNKGIVHAVSGFQVNVYCSTKHSSWPNGRAASPMKEPGTDWLMHLMAGWELSHHLRILLLLFLSFLQNSKSLNLFPFNVSWLLGCAEMSISLLCILHPLKTSCTPAASEKVWRFRDYKIPGNVVLTKKESHKLPTAGL